MAENYRITKFDPDRYETEGDWFYLSEWTSISDIGKPEYKNLTYQDYERVETAYVNAIYSVLAEKKVESLFIDSIEHCWSKEDFKLFEEEGKLKNLTVDFETEILILRNGSEIKLKLLDKYIRLLLRETINALLVNVKIEFAFYWDFILYLECEELEMSTIQKIEESGLFIMKSEGRPNFIVTSE